MKVKKRKKKDDNWWNWFTKEEWVYFILVGALVVGFIKYGYPIIRAYFGIE